MSKDKCKQCGAPLESFGERCKYCGAIIEVETEVKNLWDEKYTSTKPKEVSNGDQKNPEDWPSRSKALAGLLALLFGGVGAHKFYLGHFKLGILYILFLWTGIPPFIGVAEAFIYWFSKPEVFEQKHHVQLY